jgi:acyl CoA:acetate/3-ketoacid CoA transferase beta subunit
VSDWTRDEMMTVAAARQLWDDCVCFVGIGLPSAACNLARLTHAPDVVLIYESGTLGTRPDVLPLSIGDGGLAGAQTTRESQFDHGKSGSRHLPDPIEATTRRRHGIG